MCFNILAQQHQYPCAKTKTYGKIPLMEKSEKYLKILSSQYKTERAIITELVNTQAILNLPKGTEHFLTDIHGEYEQFNHVLKNGSGSIWQKIDEVFGLSESEETKKELATLIYYPAERLELKKSNMKSTDYSAGKLNDWYAVTLHRLVLMLRRVSSKYTRSYVRKKIPQEFAYIIEELITEKEEISDKKAYYSSIIQTIIRIGAADEFIITFCNLIQELVIYHLHIIGDIFDRGPYPHLIIEKLMAYHSVDIQWGNHDIVWMGAAAGSWACIATVLRLCTKYKNLEVLEEGYGINLTPFVTFAYKTYKNSGENNLLNAAAMLQYKLEGQMILAHPEFNMNYRLFLDTINTKKGEVTIDGLTYKLNCMDFPTLDIENPYKLTDEEEEIMNRLCSSFRHCERLQKHVRFLYEKGNIYKIYNGNLLYHGCVPLTEDGNFAQMNVYGKTLSGKALYDELEIWARKGFLAKPNSAEKQKGCDILWYLWTGSISPMFGKDRMTTFERMYLDDSSDPDAVEKAKIEHKNPYYAFLENPAIIKKIFDEFGIDWNSGHIINGHVPQKVKKGETPIKCGGKLLIIDGGFSAAYHKATGIAGYTLVSNSKGIRLVVHKKFENALSAIMNETDIISDTITVETFAKRKYISDTEPGKQLKEHVADLEALLEAYRNGSIIPESDSLYK